MKEKVLKTILDNKLIENGDKVICAVSGGPDSIAMLDCLIKIKNDNVIDFDIVVCHVNHMLREVADSEEEFVKDFCNKNEILFFSKRCNVKEIANREKLGEEETGRKVRYDFFEEVLEEVHANKIAIAHNRNDKIETIIMNLFRGSGVSGLKGIEISRGHYIRPILECERDEIEKYCEDNNLNPRIDQSNFNNDYTRNKVRNVLIPYIKKEFNPNIISTLNRLSILVKDDELYFEKEVLNQYNRILIDEKVDCDYDKEIVIDLKEFNLLDKAIKSRIILLIVQKLFNTTKGIEKIHIEDVIRLCDRNIGNKFLTPNKNLKVLVKKGKIFFISLF